MNHHKKASKLNNLKLKFVNTEHMEMRNEWSLKKEKKKNE